MPKVKNKATAAIQITAEQLLREAKKRDLEILPPPPKQISVDSPHKFANYQKQIERARSIYERALEVDHRNIALWLKYTEMEMRNRQMNHARNLWDRAVIMLPRVNQFWYKYTYLEETLENIAGTRQIFKRWMEWEPDEQAWQTYIKFELRYRETDRARQIYERFVMVHPDVRHWIKYARFEESYGFIKGARAVYEHAVNFYGDEGLDEKLFLAFAKFEEGQREHDRARIIYKYALENIPKSNTQEIYNAYTIHEKKYGDHSGIEDVIVSKRKHQYEQEIKENPSNYDAWFDYLRLVESEGNIDVIRETYERAVANVPPIKEKQFWRRYIYLWIKYALFEELEAKDVERCRQVYKVCLELIPHKRFTFSKIWLLYAYFEIRQKDLLKARKTLGLALGICPKDKLYRGYIDLEIQLVEFDRCRKLYEKFLEFGPENCTTWMRFAELETRLSEIDRARSIYEFAVARPRLDMPELLWKSYIDFEIAQGKTENARQLFERLLERTLHVKVWIAYAKFELLNPQLEDSTDNVILARRIFERGNDALRSNGDTESRVLLLEAWKDFEGEKGTPETLAKIVEKMPRRVKKKRRVMGKDGSDDGWEETFDFVFPEDESQRPNLKFLASAKAWKKQSEQSQS